jgi:nuclear receptor subfamily 1 group F protein 4
MSRDAVKFGRMSKKQRERVEDEANFHKRNRLNGFPENLSFDNTNNNQYPYPNAQYQFSPNGYAYGVGTTYANQGPLESPTYVSSDTSQVIIKSTDDIDLGLLSKAIADAHARTCLFTNEQIERMRSQTASAEQVESYAMMSHMQLWVEIAEKVTMTVQQIIEFAKMVPGFMNLLQDDQIMLLKGGSFEIALLRLCRAYDVPNNRVIFGSAFIPLEAFSSLNEEECSVMAAIFAFAKEMVNFNLTENELALLCSVVLIDPSRPGVKDTTLIQKLSERIGAALKLEVGKNHPDEETFKNRLLEHIQHVHDLSTKHIQVLNRFKMANPGVEFPALHKELFSPEGMEAQ